MSFRWPEYSTPIPIDDKRSWTAEFESFDQRNDDAYYVVTLYQDGEPAGKLMAQVSVYSTGNSPGFDREVRNGIHAVATAGRSNTDYKGPVGRHVL